MTATDSLKHFLTAPLRGRSYLNFLYLALAFPLGLVYFVFLTVGLITGVGLTIIWVGLPILALVFAGSWGLMALERWTAIHLLGAEVPPMAPPPPVAPQGFWKSVGAFFSNPVTWKGMAFLLLKFPLGIATFVVTVFLVAVTGAFLSAPFTYGWGGMEIDFGVWYLEVDTLGEALVCFLIGLVLSVVTLNLLNGLGALWKHLASFLLGSRRFALPGGGATSGPAEALPEPLPA